MPDLGTASTLHWPPSGLGQWGAEDRVVTEITMGYLLGRIQIMVDTLSMVQKLQEVLCGAIKKTKILKKMIRIRK